MKDLQPGLTLDHHQSWFLQSHINWLARQMLLGRHCAAENFGLMGWINIIAKGQPSDLNFSMSEIVTASLTSGPQL